jgi:hypothetical protein
MPVNDEQVVIWAVRGRKKEHLMQNNREVVPSELQTWGYTPTL